MLDFYLLFIIRNKYIKDLTIDNRLVQSLCMKQKQLYKSYRLL